MRVVVVLNQRIIKNGFTNIFTTDELLNYRTQKDKKTGGNK